LITDSAPDRVAEIAFARRVVLHELTPIQTSLEDAYFALTHDEVEFTAANHDSRRVA
jgi:ABC-2 type transport system ATP-binding protein